MGYTIHIDGSSRFNPGPAGIGIAIIDPDGNVTREISRFIGIRTNNQAEYEALLCALHECRRLAAPVVIKTDSELLYYQIIGRYRVRDPKLKQLHGEAIRLLQQLPQVGIELVRRDCNKLPDRLARAASEAVDVVKKHN